MTEISKTQSLTGNAGSTEVSLRSSGASQHTKQLALPAHSLARSNISSQGRIGATALFSLLLDQMQKGRQREA